MAATRTNPVPLGEHEGPPPQRERSGFWKEQLNDVLKPNAGKTYVYGNASASTATNLRRDHGLDAYTVTRDGETKLYVTYDPARVDEIKREVAERGAKRKATIEANKANGKGKSNTAKAAAK